MSRRICLIVAYELLTFFQPCDPPHCPSTTGDEDDDEDHDVAAVPEDNDHEDDHKDDPQDNPRDDPQDDHKDDPQNNHEDDPMSTKKPPAIAKATTTKPAEVVISPSLQKNRAGSP